MEHIKISVGTKSKVKIEAVENTVAKMINGNTTIEAVEVNSGISDNPITHKEAIIGAKNRALGSCSKTNSNIGIGIEGNLFKESSKWFLTTWVVLVDKGLEKEYLSQGIAVSILDDNIIAQIDKLNPIGEVFKNLPDEYDYKKYGNPMKYLTGGVFDRSRAISIALEACFSQLLRNKDFN